MNKNKDIKKEVLERLGNVGMCYDAVDRAIDLAIQRTREEKITDDVAGAVFYSPKMKIFREELVKKTREECGKELREAWRKQNENQEEWLNAMPYHDSVVERQGRQKAIKEVLEKVEKSMEETKKSGLLDMKCLTEKQLEQLKKEMVK